jgi:acyl dehydratase
LRPWKHAHGAEVDLKITGEIVGTAVGPLENEIDARWLMAYSAALGETQTRYFDTSAEGGVLAHPLFAVCYEWPVSQPIRRVPALREYFSRLVHAEHDLTIHRPVRQGDRLRTAARIVRAEERKPGAFVVFRFATSDAAGAAVTTSDYGLLYRDVALERPGSTDAPLPSLPPVENDLKPIGRIEIAANAAHVYTECARIWNPIHTDIAHARAAGLPGIILHGTATLALSLSRMLSAFGADPASVRRLQCRFSGMVLMPSTLEVRGAVSGRVLAFETRRADAQSVISRGRIELRG